ncbi:MAG: hypothetical protein AAB698_01195 [Patescibacteria group bacterium]
MVKEKELAKSDGLLLYCACGKIKIFNEWLRMEELSERKILSLERAGKDGRIMPINGQCPECISI